MDDAEDAGPYLLRRVLPLRRTTTFEVDHVGRRVVTAGSLPCHGLGITYQDIAVLH